MRFFRTLILGALSLALLSTPVYAAGTIFGLGLSQQVGADREPLSGAELYIYEAGTSTPVTIYQDYALTDQHPFPLSADSAGRLPAFWLEDGSYRVRLTTSEGVEVFDYNSITAIGPSSGTGGGSGSSVGDDEIFQTGDPICTFTTGARSGWVRANARTIGSSSSGATERANADVQALFEHLWNNCSDTDCPVSTGRGANASADWSSNKTIGLPDMRGRALVGVDDMGNTAAGVLSGETTIVDGGGAATTTSVPAHTHDSGSYQAANHSHGSGSLSVSPNPHNHSLNQAGNTDSADFPDGGGSVSVAGIANATVTSTSLSIIGSTALSGALSVSGTSGSTGDASVSIMDPYRLCTFYIKL